MSRPILLAALLLLAGRGAAHASAEASPAAWDGWKCDDLTPDLCDLKVEEGSVFVHGLSIHYWKYFSAENDVEGDRRLEHTKHQRNHKHNKGAKELPVIMVNGGPCWAHNYMLPLRQIACRGGGSREVVFYDQAGTGKSILPTAGRDDIDDAKEYPWLVDAAYYATKELPALISHLGYDEFHLIGHSWGTMVAQLFALDAPSEGLRSLTLSGPVSDTHLYSETSRSRADDGGHGGISSMPPYMQERIRVVEAAGAYGSPEYKALDDAFLSMFLTRVQPLADCLEDALSGANNDLYLAMAGPNDFRLGGSLHDFNTTGRLGEINVPVLLTNGEYDFMRPALTDALEMNLPVTERIVFTKSAHNSMQDDAGSMNDAVSDFLFRVEDSINHGKRRFHPKGNGKIQLLPSFASMDILVTNRVHSIWNRMPFLATLSSILIGVMLGVFLSNSYSQRHIGYETL